MRREYVSVGANFTLYHADRNARFTSAMRFSSRLPFGPRGSTVSGTWAKTKEPKIGVLGKLTE